MFDFFATSEFWTALASLVAIAALIRPDVEKIVKAKRSSVRFINTGRLEVGLTGLGPSIGIVGTVIVTGPRRIYVEMRSVVQRKRDGASFILGWRFFRPLTMSESREHFGQNTRIAHPIAVQEGHAECMNVFLVDGALWPRLEPEVERMRSAWAAHRAALRVTVPSSEAGIDTREIRELYFQWSRTSPESRRLWQALEDEFYWKEGECDIKVQFKNEFEFWESAAQYNFSIKREQSEKLRANITFVNLLAARDVLSDWVFEHIYVDVQEQK